MHDDVVLIVFSRAPEPGKVKTRLIDAVGEQQATDIYKQLLANTIKAAVSSAFSQVELCIAGDVEHPFIKSISEEYGFPVYAQQGDDLGMRMYHALAQALLRYSGAVLVGCDCAGLTEDDLNQAREALLERTEVVLGPSTDGGYYLVGMSQPYQELFTDMTWGSETVLQETLARIQQQGLGTTLIAELTDIDCAEDLANLNLVNSLLT